MFHPAHFRKTAKELGMDPLSYEKEYNLFLAKLQKFHESKGSPFRRLPWLGGQYLDLYLLYKKVTLYGGWIKITEDKKWRDIAEVFNLPSTCTNAAFALRQHYARYLETYERIHFFGEDAEDVMTPSRPHTPVSAFPGPGPSEYISQGTPVVDITRNFEKLVLSLQCGLPNEVDFGINICMLLSNVNNSVFNLTKAPAIIDMLMGHVGIYIEDSHGLGGVYSDWYQHTERDFIKFWRETLEIEDFRDLLCNGEGKTEYNDEDQLFHPGKKYGVNSVEAQRVAQVCMILYNFSFDEANAVILACHSMCLRFLILCVCNQIGYLQSLAWNTLSNLAEKMKLDPVESKNTQLVFQILHYFVQDKDRFKVLKAMDVLGKMCIREDNDEVVEMALDIQAYESLVRILIIPDVQLVIGSLEALYNISGVGQETSDNIASVDHSVDILVCMVTLDAEFFGAQALSEVVVIENRLPASIPMTPRPRPTHTTPGTTATSPHAPMQTSKNEIDAEAFTVKWVQATYEALPSGTVSRIDLYADYLSSCSRLARIGILNASAFNRIVKFVFPDAQLRRFPTGNQLQYALCGMRRRANPLPVKSSIDQHQAPNSPSPGPVQSRTPTPPIPGRSSPNWPQGTPQRPVPQGMNMVRQAPSSPTGVFSQGGLSQKPPNPIRRPSFQGTPGVVNDGQVRMPGQFTPQPQGANQRPLLPMHNQTPIQQQNVQRPVVTTVLNKPAPQVVQVVQQQWQQQQQRQQNAVVSQNAAYQASQAAQQQNTVTFQQNTPFNNSQQQVSQVQGQVFSRPVAPIQPRPPQLSGQSMPQVSQPLTSPQIQQQVQRVPQIQAGAPNMVQRSSSSIAPRIAPRPNIYPQQGLIPIRPAPSAPLIQSPAPSSSQPGPGHNERPQNGPSPMGAQRPYQFTPQRPHIGQDLQKQNFTQGNQQGFQQQVPRSQSLPPPFSGQPRQAPPQMAPPQERPAFQGVGGFAGRGNQPIAIAPKPVSSNPSTTVVSTAPSRQGTDGVVLIAREEKAEDILSSDILNNAEEQRIIVVENRNNTHKKVNSTISNNGQETRNTSLPCENNVEGSMAAVKRDYKSRHANLNSEGLVNTNQNGINSSKRTRLDETNESTIDCTSNEPSAMVNGDIRTDPRHKLMDKLLGKDLRMPLNGVCDINSADLDLMATQNEHLSGSNSKTSSPDIFDSENNSDFGKYLEESDTDTGLFSDVILGDLRIDSVDTDSKSKNTDQHKNIPTLPDLGYHAVAQELRNPGTILLRPNIETLPPSKGLQNNIHDKVPITAVSANRPTQQRAPGPHDVVSGRYGNNGFHGRPNPDTRTITTWNGSVRPPVPPNYNSVTQGPSTTPQSIRPPAQQQQNLNAILEHRTKALVTPKMSVTEQQDNRLQFAAQQQAPSPSGIPDAIPVPVSTAVPSSSSPVDGQVAQATKEPAAVDKPFRCRWANCTSSFDGSKQLFGHVVSTHVPRDSLVLTCLWENCAPVRRSRSSLLFHLQQKHSEPTPSTPSNPTPQPPPQQAQAQPTPTGQQQAPKYLPAYQLLARMMSTMQEDEESPLTKTVRLTSALVLRNIAQYSAIARSHLRRHERLLSEVAMSHSEAAHAVAACLSELSPHRKTSDDDSNTFIWAFDR